MKLSVFNVVVIVLLWFVPCFGANAQNNDMQFEYLTTKEGVSSNVIYSMMQDSYGFIWIGTKEGVNRFDGVSMIKIPLVGESWNIPAHRRVNTLYEDFQGYIWLGTSNGMVRFDVHTGMQKHYSLISDVKSAQSAYVNALLTTGNGTLWVGTRNGIYTYNRSSDSFRRYDHFPHHTLSNSFSKGERVVKAMAEDRFGKLWIATAGDGVSVLDTLTHKRIVYGRNPRQEGTLSSNFVSHIYEDQYGVIWVATANGLNRFNREKGDFRVFSHRTSDSNSLSSNFVTVIGEDHHGHLMVGTKDGLDVFNRQKNSFSHYKNHPHHPSSLSSNNVLCMLRDKSGTFWIGTMLGVNWYTPTSLSFDLFQNIPGDSSSLSNNTLRAVTEDSKGNIWVGTMSDGINRLDPKSGKFTPYRMPSARDQKYNAIRTVAVDRKGQLLFGTDKGVLRYDEKYDKFKPYNFEGNIKFNRGVFAILQTRDGVYWLAEIDRGLVRYDPRLGSVREYRKNKADSTAISSSNIKVLYQTSNGTLWMGTHLNGVSRLNNDGNTFSHYYNIPGQKGCLSDNRVYAIHEDNGGQLWLGTGKGLNRYVPESDSFEVFSKKDGLPGNVILSIEHDSIGRLWLGTNHGLSCFDPRTHRFVNFTREDGLQGNIFEYKVACTTRGGRMFFGGNNGLNKFDPLEFKANYYLSRPCITEVSSGGKPMSNSIVQKQGAYNSDWPLIVDGPIKLGSGKQDVRIDFSAMSFINPHKNRYQYRIFPKDTQWKMVEENRHYVGVSGLPAGKYQFQLKASNDNALWSPYVAKLDIVVFRSWTLYVYIALGMMLFGFAGWLGFWYHNGKDKRGIATANIFSEKPRTVPILPQGKGEIPEKLKVTAQQLLDKMEESKWYLDKKLSKSYLALLMGVSESTLSTVLRDVLQISFSDFINGYRVDEVKKKFHDPKSRDYTLLGIAEECGFNSKTSFYRIFKKFTGVTPSEYLEYLDDNK